MILGKAIYSILSNDGNVSSTVSTRIYPDTVPQNATFPYLVYTIIGADPSDIKDGVSPTDSVRLQVDIYSQSYDTTSDLVEDVRSALDDYSGTAATVDIQRIRYATEGSGAYDEDLQVFWRSLDFNVRYNR